MFIDKPLRRKNSNECLKSKLEELRGHKIVAVMLHEFYILNLSSFQWIHVHSQSV